MEINIKTKFNIWDMVYFVYLKDSIKSWVVKYITIWEHNVYYDNWDSYYHLHLEKNTFRTKEEAKIFVRDGRKKTCMLELKKAIKNFLSCK
jgi:hypothetical protein